MPLSSQPTVSIVIPVYNGGRFLAPAIESVLGQEYERLEVIVVDDGSDDGSGEVAACYSERVTLIRQQNQGQSVALAVGWDRAAGEVVGYLSADDLLRRNAIARTVAALVERPDAVLAYPDFGIIDSDGMLTRIARPPAFTRRALFADLHCLPGPGALFRKSALLAAGPWRRDMRQMPDLEFYLRLADQGDFVHVPEVLADFRKHEGSTTYRPVPVERCDEPLRIVEGILAQAGLPDDVRAWRHRMRASAHYLSATLHGQSGRSASAAKQLAVAALSNPRSLASRRALSAVARTLLSVRLVGRR